MTPDRPVRTILLALVLTRLVLAGAATAGLHLLALGPGLEGANLRWQRSAPAALDVWARWDAEWYLLIAAEGYTAPVARYSQNPGNRPEDTTGFFPLYPMAIRVLAPAFGFLGAGILVANAALVAAALLVLSLARELWGTRRGTSIGVAAAVGLTVAPYTVFLSAVYAESLFLALSLATVLLAHRQQFAAASAVGALAALTRPFGLILVVPMALEWWRGRASHRWGWLSLAAPPAALGSYMLFCWSAFGDPLSFVVRQERWRGAMAAPWTAFVRWWQEGPRLMGGHDSTAELVIAVVTLVLTAWAIRRLPRSLGAYLVLGALLPLTSTLWSYGRITLTLFPLHLALGWLWATRRPRWLVAAACVSLLFASAATALYAAGHWVS